MRARPLRPERRGRPGPAASADGSVEARPTILSVKKSPIESTLAAFWKVAFMPPPTPRCDGGRLFITAARFAS